VDQATIPASPAALTGARSAPSAAQAIPRKIGIYAHVGWNNYGNDGSFEVMLDFLRRSLPDAELKVICVDPGEIERRYNIPTIPISWRGFAGGWQRRCNRLSLGLLGKFGNIAHSIREVGQFDFMVVPGTGVLCDYRSSPFGAPYWILRWSVSARLRGVRLFMVSIGAGPIQHPLSRWMLKHAARTSAYLSFRDQYSKNFATGMGLETTENPVFPDLVFKLPFPRVKPDKPAAHCLTIGVGVMSYNGWQGHRRDDTVVYDTYLTELKRFVIWLLRSGYRVRLLVGEITDSQTVEDLRRLVLGECRDLPDDVELVASPAQSLRDVMAQVAETDIVVASRFHNIIAALKQGRPTISISYTQKHDELMREMGLEMFCQPIEQLDADVLVQQFRDLVRARAAIGQRVRDKVEAYEGRLAEQDRMLLDLLR
jgi:polysaccharide pyruvyl transferase WcaK-like protein